MPRRHSAIVLLLAGAVTSAVFTFCAQRQQALIDGQSNAPMFLTAQGPVSLEALRSSWRMPF